MSQNIWADVGVVVLAAGQGKRLNSAEIPKVMLSLGSRPMIDYTIETLEKVGFLPEQICVVVGFQKEKVREYLGGRVCYAVQEELLGTAHAAYTGMKSFSPLIKHVLVIGGDDSAFYTPETLRQLIKTHLAHKNILTLLSAEVPEPPLVGRVVRHSDGRIEIVEKEYLTDEQRQIREVSTGTFMFDRAWFEEVFPTMPKLRKLGEYGLPTTLALAQAEHRQFEVVPLKNPDEWFGVNTPEELAEAEKRKTT
ncbi:MAG: NTP transferase domain-containing protein [Candidatus Magasanikbacteria bacterium]|nr:NTP transferase domain-containing protein [Candidatus Magasanikbacteria bacterium]